MYIKKLMCITIIMALLSSIFPTAGFAEDKVEFYMNKTSAGYVEEKGLFFDDVANKDSMGKTTRYSFSSNAKLSYNLNVSKEGNYIIYYWNTGDNTNRNQQEFLITSDDGVSSVKLNLKGDAGWKYLGVYKFTPGQTANVSIAREKKGAAIRSGALRVMSTDKPTAVAHSQEPPAVKRYYLPGDGIHVINTFPSEDYVFEESDGSFGNVLHGNCTGRASRYSNSVGSKMRYRPNIKTAGEYHVLYFSVQTGATTPTALKTVVYHGGKSASLTVNCAEHNGWVYLGKYEFKEGNEGYLETINEESGKQHISGGAYFVSADDENFDPSLYATIDNPGSKVGAKPLETGEYIIGTDDVGYCEVGRKDYFKVTGELLDCNGKYSMYFGGEGTENSSMTYSASIEEAGEYEVFYYVIQDSKNAANQEITVISDGGNKESVLTLDCINHDGWISLGKYNFAQDSLGTVVTPSMGADGRTRSGGVKFVKQ